MTAREAASNVMALEYANVLRESVAVMVKEIMELGIAQLAGAELGERVPDRRLAQRNGYRDRRWDSAWVRSSLRSRGYPAAVAGRDSGARRRPGAGVAGRRAAPARGPGAGRDRRGPPHWAGRGVSSPPRPPARAPRPPPARRRSRAARRRGP